ncbi:MAG: radical SAM protein [Actinomycetota bacterium]|nr:radical SAM protein [Actinomycetota bacterium]
MHELIVSPFMGEYLVLRPGFPKGVKIPHRRYQELVQAAKAGTAFPAWLADAARRAWSLETVGGSLNKLVIVRAQTRYNYGRASYELNLGCNYACKHCYLGLKEFAGLTWSDREQLLYILRDAGVLWLQLTGGEPMIDKFFAAVYVLAYELGMMIEILTNGSRLSNSLMLDLLTRHRPHRITLSVYGATEESYDTLTQRRGAYNAFIRGLTAAHEARLPLDFSVIITKDNAHEIDQMHSMAEHYGVPSRDFVNMSPTIYGGAESLPSQSPEHLTQRTPFTGCDAGNAFFHVDPFGKASICKVGRNPQISLLEEGVDGLCRLGGIADRLLLRQGGCAGCALSGTCGTCMPLVTLFRKAKAPLDNYCQHTEERR